MGFRRLAPAVLWLVVGAAAPAGAQVAPFSFGGPQEDVATALDVLPDGTFAIGGSTYGGYDPDPGPADATVPNGGRSDGFAAVYGPDRALRFVVPFGPPGPSSFDEVFSVALGPSGELAVAGQVGEVLDLDPGPGQSLIEAPGLGIDVFLAVYEPDGALRYGFTVPGFDFGQRAYVDLDASGNVYLLGSVDRETDLDPGPGQALVDGFRSATLASYAPDGAFRWGFAIEGAQYRARGLAVAGGRVAITGNLITGAVDVDPGPAVREIEGAAISDWLTATYTTGGELVSAFVVGGSAFGGVTDVALDADGGVALVGTIDRDADFDPTAGTLVLSGSGNGTEGLGVVARYAPDATLRFAFGVGTARPRRVALGGGRLVWTGHFEDPLDADPGEGTAVVVPEAGYDVVTVSLDAAGGFEWASVLTGPGTGDNGLGVGVDGQGQTLVTGRFSGTVDADPGAGVLALASASPFDYDVFVVAYDSRGALAARPTPTDTEPEAAVALAVYPSPTSGPAWVRVPGRLASGRVSVHDALGREVAVLHDGPVPAQGLRLAVPRLAAGAYTVRAGATASARLVVVR